MVEFTGKDGGGVASLSVPHGSAASDEPSNGAYVPDAGATLAGRVGDVVVIGFNDVERGLVEVMELWRRTPGSGRGSPFASDGPWELADRDLYGPDVDKDVPLRPAPLSRAEVAERDRVSAWIELVQERDRRLVSLAVVQMSSRGYKSPGFKELLPAMGLRLGADGLRKRYNRAIYKIASELNSQAGTARAADERR